MPRMTKEEKNLLDSYENGGWKSVKNLKTEINHYQKIAQATPPSSQAFSTNMPQVA